MVDNDYHINQFISFKVIQSGKILKIPLSKLNLRKQFEDIYRTLLKELKLRPKSTYLSNENGLMISNADLELSLEEIINKFGNKLKLYYEKIF